MTRTFFERLGDELDAASRRPARRPAPPRIAALAAAAVVVIAALTVTLGRDPASASVDVAVRDGLVYVRLVDAEHDPAAIERATSKAGLDVAVEAVPVGPSLVGKFLTFERYGDLPGELRPLDRDGDTFAGFVLPSGWDGHLELLVGRPVARDEAYRVVSNAASPGEPLACRDVLGKHPGELRDDLRGLAVAWQVSDRQTRMASADEVQAEPLRGYRVAAAYSLAPKSVVLRLTPDGTPPPGQELLTKPAEGC